MQTKKLPCNPVAHINSSQYEPKKKKMLLQSSNNVDTSMKVKLLAQGKKSFSSITIGQYW